MNGTTYVYHDGLESTRLKTRFLSTEDADFWEEYYLSDGREKYLLNLGGTSPKENARLAVERQLRRYRNKTYGLQALIEKESGAIVGQCGLLIQTLNGKTELEIGYQLFNEHWGKYYATEAAMLFRDYGFSELQADSIMAIIDINNTSSQKVAIRIGMQREETILYMGSEVYIYRMSREVWLSL